MIVLEILMTVGGVYFITVGIGMCLNRCYWEHSWQIMESIDFIAPVKKDKGCEDICSICLDDLKGKTIRETLCGHRYCKKCIEEWLQKKFVCPNCNCELMYYNLDSSYIA